MTRITKTELYESLKKAIKFLVIEDGNELDVNFDENVVTNIVVQQYQDNEHYAPLILTNKELGIAYQEDEEKSNFYLFCYHHGKYPHNLTEETILKKLKQVIHEDCLNGAYKVWRDANLNFKVFILTDSLKNSLNAGERFVENKLTTYIKDQLNMIRKNVFKDYIEELENGESPNSFSKLKEDYLNDIKIIEENETGENPYKLVIEHLFENQNLGEENREFIKNNIENILSEEQAFEERQLTSAFLESVLVESDDHRNELLENEIIKASIDEHRTIKLIDDLIEFRKILINTLTKARDIKQNEKTLVNYKLRDINIVVDFLEQKSVTRNYDVAVRSRTFATTAVRLKNPETEGHVFTAKLFDIVKLYNAKGKGLFDKNIRMGIEDVLNVDVAINETLENAPSEFWYLNNGITILVEKGNLDLRKNNQITLKDNVYSKLGLTVINGAQTINSAARFFYKREENDSVRINAEKNAYVMLKVVEINSSLGKAQNNEQDNTQENDQNNDQSNAHDANKLHERINQITISLNRQKPVVIEDIAYTLPVINFINELKYKFDAGLAEKHPELRKLLFNIVRRGEVAVVEKQRYTLKILPRILMTILLNKPGKARTAGLKTLIKINSEGNHFEDRDLFPIFERTESGNAEQATNNEETVDPNLRPKYEFFKKNYAAVNFSMQLYEKLETYAEKKDLFENEFGPSQIQKYGKYLMIYTIVQALKYLSMNDEGTLQVEHLENEKYSSWEYDNSHVSQFLTDDNYKNIVRILAEKWKAYHVVTAESNANDWDSNVFKKDEVVKVVAKESNANYWDSNVFKKDEVVKVVAKESLEDIITLFNPAEDETTH